MQIINLVFSIIHLHVNQGCPNPRINKMEILHHGTAEREMDFTHHYNRFHKNVDTIYWKISALDG